MMFRFILFAISLLIVGILCGQSNLYPDTLGRNNQLDYAILYQDCNFCIPAKENQPIRKYYFDEQGLNYKIEGLDSLMRPSSRILIKYDKDQLHSYDNYSSYVGVYPDYEMHWDSTSRLQKVVYNYDDNKLKTITWLEEDDRIHFDIVFEYNESDKVIKEVQKWYAYPDAISFQAFESNTADFLDSIKVLEDMTREKIYKYGDLSCKITYLVNSKQTGVEEITYMKNDLISSRLLKDIQGDTLLLETFMYDDFGRVGEQNLIDVGYDAFGDSHDFFDFGKVQYLYDEEGRLKAVKQYYNDEDFLLKTYVYYKK